MGTAARGNDGVCSELCGSSTGTRDGHGHQDISLQSPFSSPSAEFVGVCWAPVEQLSSKPAPHTEEGEAHATAVNASVPALPRLCQAWESCQLRKKRAQQVRGDAGTAHSLSGSAGPASHAPCLAKARPSTKPPQPEAGGVEPRGRCAAAAAAPMTCPWPLGRRRGTKSKGGAGLSARLLRHEATGWDGDQPAAV